MTNKLFDIVGDTIIPKPDCQIIMPIKDIIENYPDDHLKIIAFLHYMNSMNPNDNPYADVPLIGRAEKIIQELRIDIDPDADDIQAALECVEEMYYTTFYGVYKGFKASLDKLGEKLLNEDLDLSRDGNGAAIRAYMKDYEQLRRSFKTA